MMRWILVMAMTVLPVIACAQEPPAIKTPKDKLSYAMGMDLGAQLKEKSVEIDPAVFARGLADALAGRKTTLTEAEAKAAITELQLALASKQAAAVKAVSEKNKAEGDAFLAANKTKPGVVTLPSGVQYKMLVAGTGKKPAATDTVVCNYRGTFIDGREFDNSARGGKPAEIVVGRVIKGWAEILPMMPVGSKWQVFVPSNLAYGERGMGADIGPNATLIFEIELVAIK
jgi:FKBP-type peptidyl-prolyl cis-trans isomerase